MCGNIKEAYLLHICHGFSTMVSLTYKGEASERIREHNEESIMTYTYVTGERVNLIIQYYSMISI